MTTINKRPRSFVSAALAGIVLAITASCTSKPKTQVESAYDESTAQREKLTPEISSRAVAESKKVMVSTQGTASTDAAVNILRQGGNLTDAAIAASFVISVERPHSTGLGGGGFWIYHSKKRNRTWVFDFRERAPKKAHEKMYLDDQGNVIPKKSSLGVHAIAVPGLIKGLAQIHKRFGKLSWKKVIAPAIALAEKGVPVYPRLERSISYLRKKTQDHDGDSKISDPELNALILRSDGSPKKIGDVIVQKDLAQSLRTIARDYGKSFYHGKWAKDVEKFTQGWITRADLAEYQVKERQVLRQRIRDYDLLTMPPPSSGGAHVIQIVKIFEALNGGKWPWSSAQSIHRLAFAEQTAFFDRAQIMGDPDFVGVPLDPVVSDRGAVARARFFDPKHARKMDDYKHKTTVNFESPETTHFSMMTADGDAIVSTQTINGGFGSGLVLPGTGIILNNEMDDFSSKPGDSNIFGALGSEANSVQPGKTPLSSMSPTLVLKNGDPILAVGAPGGTRIISCVAQTLLNHLWYNLPLDVAVAAPRLHHQYSPDRLDIEPGRASPHAYQELKRIGYDLNPDEVGCATMAVSKKNDGKLIGVSEVRDAGSAKGL